MTGRFCLALAFLPALVIYRPHTCTAQTPDHPIITEVYTDPPGDSDGPVGRDPQNLHQEFIEIYLPACAQLNPSLNCDALNLTLYEVEGDASSSGLGLVNYRIDLPTFDLNPANGLSGLARPASGVVVLGWVDYNAGVTDLLGTPNTRVALIDGGVTSTSGYTFIAMNGDFGSGTTNFPTPGSAGVSSIDEADGEAASGVIQNGSSAWLLVNRDDPGYAQLFDDEHVPAGQSADPALPSGTVLGASALLDGYAGNDDELFNPASQPLPPCFDPPADCIDFQTVLPQGGAFSLLIAQIAEQTNAGLDPGQANGYARVYVDLARTTEGAATDNPAADAANAYRHVRNNGPFLADPGRVVFSTSAPELGVASDSATPREVLGGTTRVTSVTAANIGGDFPIDIAITSAVSDAPAVAGATPGAAALNVGGQDLAQPQALLSGNISAGHGAQVGLSVTVTADNSAGGDPAVLNPVALTSLTARVLNPTTGQDAAGQPFQTTVFAALHAVVSNPGVTNEFLGTSLAAYLAAQPDVAELDTEDHGPALLDPATDLSNPLVVQPWVKEMPEDGEECTNWLNPPGPIGGLDLAQTVENSAENLSGAGTYEDSISDCGATVQTVIRAIRLNVPDTRTFDGSFSPSETVHFVEPGGAVGNSGSLYTGVTTLRTFEVALLDTAVRPNGTLESGASDDFGIVVEALEVEPGAPVQSGEYVFLSFSGGLQGADIDTVGVPPGNMLATVILLDLDNLHDVLGIRTIEALYIIDGGSGGVDMIEAFSLNPPQENECIPDLNGDNVVNPSDLAALLGAWGPNPGHPADFNDDGVVNAADLAQLLGAWGPC